MRTRQNLLSEKGPAATYENNKAQPVTIGNPVGLRIGLQDPDYRAARDIERGLHPQTRAIAML